MYLAQDAILLVKFFDSAFKSNICTYLLTYVYQMQDFEVSKSCIRYRFYAVNINK